MGQFNPFVCPLPAALTTPPDTTCPVRFDQIIGVALHRIAGGKAFSASTILASATWTPLLAATDNTKVVLTPAFSGFTLPTSEVTIEGENDNSTIGGLGIVEGGNVVRPTGMFRNKSAVAMKAIRSYTTESANSSAPRIEAYFINRFGQIIANSDGSGIPVTNITVSDVSSEGLKKDNMNTFGLSLPYGWSDDVAMFTPSFDILALQPK